MRRLYGSILLVITSMIGGCLVAFAADQSSTNYEIKENTFVPASFNVNSASYIIDGSVEATVGLSDSANFTLRHGVPVKDLPAPTPPAPTPTPTVITGGGGGGGGFIPGPAATTSPTVTTTTPPVVTPSGTAKSPTLLYHSQTYLSHTLIYGKLGATGDVLTVNGSQNGVKYLSDLGWQLDMPLFVGYNEIRIQVKNSIDQYSDVIAGTVERMLIGNGSRLTDKTVEHVVGDVDISLFTRAWKKYDFYSDYNEDGKIDDIDLSLMVSHWNMTVNY